MADTTTANAPPSAQPSHDPLPQPRGHIVFTGKFVNDTRLRFFVNWIREQEVRDARNCISYTIEAEAERPQKSTRPTPTVIVEQHGWFRNIGAFQDICEGVPMPDVGAAIEGETAEQRRVRDKAAFRAWRADVLKQLEQHYNDSWKPI
ncbi:hypothetical protein BDV95DRAFT_597963 [Massariosphaeria phaeospora]|uniref:Uncharacterized protein n=1 Tax=Massariosphaeria phaeospora TaxID=100035 RepID=A0A7C8I9I4_9PLEO|nr:hypothetical protein BDV95DRAFT_597963 [Massariosphaeria phaeospora]